MGVVSTYFPPDGTHYRQLAGGDIIGAGLIALFVELSRLLSAFSSGEAENCAATLARVSDSTCDHMSCSGPEAWKLASSQA